MIKVNSQRTGRQVSINFDCGNTLEEAIMIHGSTVVFELFSAAAKVKLQRHVRNILDDPENSLDDAKRSAKLFTLR